MIPEIIPISDRCTGREWIIVGRADHSPDSGELLGPLPGEDDITDLDLVIEVPEQPEVQPLRCGCFLCIGALNDRPQFFLI
jgi:hypothetical protein